MKAIEQCFPVALLKVLLATLYKMVLTLKFVDPKVSIQMKPTVQHFSVALCCTRWFQLLNL